MVSIKRISWVIVVLSLCIGAAASVCYATDYIAYGENYWKMTVILDQATGAIVTTLPGTAAGGAGGVAFDSAGNLYTTEKTDEFAGGPSYINKWIKSGATWTEKAAPYISSPADSMPFYGVAVGADGLLYANRNWSYLDIFDVDNVPDVPTLVGEYTSTAFLDSRDIACGADGSVWIAGCNYVDVTGPEVARWDSVTHAFTLYSTPTWNYMTLTFGPDANGDGWSDVYMAGDNSIIMYSGKDGTSLGNYLTGLPNVTQCDLAFSADGKTLYYMTENFSANSKIMKYDVATETTTVFLDWPPMAWGQMTLSNPYVPVCPHTTPVNSISELRGIANGTLVSVSGKSLYLKQDTFGYIEESSRASGIRIEYSLCGSSVGDLVDVVGVVKTTTGGERYIDAQSIETAGRQAVRPLGANNRAVKMAIMSGLLVKVWGTVKVGTLTANSFVIADGSDSAGLLVVTSGAPGVTEGSYVTVTGAAGYNNGRVIYRLPSGQLSDYVDLGDSTSETAHSVSGTGSRQTLSYHIGALDETTTYRESAPTSGSTYQVVVQKRAGQSLTLQIQELYPSYGEGAGAVRYTYDVYTDTSDCPAYKRDYIGLMAGTTSYFVTVNTPSVVAASTVTVKFTNRRANAFRIAAMWAYSDFPSYCGTYNFQVPFYYCPNLYNFTQAGINWEMGYIHDALTPSGNIRVGVSQELYYFIQSHSEVEDTVGWIMECAKMYDMPTLLLYFGMWAGDPVGVSDGLGGTLADHKYEQVCWSENDNYDEDYAEYYSGKQTLRSLLGAKWNLKYGWTTPNIWCEYQYMPWLTLNSPTLNIARSQAIADRLDALKSAVVALSAGNYLIGIAMENEPRYWDQLMADMGADGDYPVTRTNLCADFNPITVADAARSSVTLDPNGGLSWAEAMWLHNNIAYFQQDTYNSYVPELQELQIPFMNSSTDSLWHEVYSHAMPMSASPMKYSSAYHPGLEWNRLAGCRVGLEGDCYPTKPYAFYMERTREWGRFADINFELTMGVPYGMRAMRSEYAFGARCFNGYNWSDENLTAANTFFADGSRYKVNEVTNQSASWAGVTTQGFTITADAYHPIMNEIDVNLNTVSEYVMTVYDSSSNARVLGHTRLNITGAGLVGFQLPNCIPIDNWTSVYVVVARVDGGSFQVLRNPSGVPVWSAWMNPDRERVQSLVISWRADAADLINDLETKGYAGNLGTAHTLFNTGDYKGAYDAAVQVETAALDAAPTGTIVINGGAANTSSLSVTLTLSASGTSGVSQMRFSNDQRTWSSWETYATSKSWTLSNWDGVGTRIVYVQYRDSGGIISPGSSDTIIFL